MPRWDLAVVPSYKGATTAKLHADAFAILKQSKDADAAFQVYLFLLNSAALREVYTGLPASRALQPAYFASLDRTFAPNQVTWQVALDSLAFRDRPNHEQAVPNYSRFQERMAAFDQLVNATPDLDLDAEIARLQTDLTAIFQGR